MWIPFEPKAVLDSCALSGLSPALSVELFSAAVGATAVAAEGVWCECDVGSATQSESTGSDLFRFIFGNQFESWPQKVSVCFCPGCFGQLFSMCVCVCVRRCDCLFVVWFVCCFLCLSLCVFSCAVIQNGGVNRQAPKNERGQTGACLSSLLGTLSIGSVVV